MTERNLLANSDPPMSAPENSYNFILSTVAAAITPAIPVASAITPASG